MTFLAPLPRDLSDLVAVNAGAPVFSRIGCNGCHTTATFTTPNPAPNVITWRIHTDDWRGGKVS